MQRQHQALYAGKLGLEALFRRVDHHRGVLVEQQVANLDDDPQPEILLTNYEGIPVLELAGGVDFDAGYRAALELLELAPV